MLGSVNSVLLNAPLVRQQADQSADSRVTAVQKGQQVDSNVESIRVFIDPALKVQVMEMLDPVTGNAINQIPSSALLELRQNEAYKLVSDTIPSADKASETPEGQEALEQQALVPPDAEAIALDHKEKSMILAALYSSVELGKPNISYLSRLV